MECLTEASNTQGAASALRDRKPDLHTRLAHAQNESQRLTHALREEKQRADTAEARADKLEEMYNRLKHKYTSLKRSIREISGESDSNLLLKCSSPEPDVEARVGKSQRTGGACASRATPSPPADLVTPVCRDNHIAERATPSPLLDNGTTPAGENAAPRPAQPPAPRFARTRLEPPSPVEQLAASPEEPVPQVTDDAETPTSAQAEEAENSSETGGEESAHDSDDELTRLAVTLSNGAGQHATNVQAQAEDDAEAASLALAMQLMQQEQALAQIYGGEHATGYGFGVEQEEEAGGADWIPAEEIEEVEVAEDALDESEATYEQLLELDEQKVVVGLSDQAKAGATKVVTLSAADVAALETLHDKRCCICLCDYEPADEVRQLPCDHGCHLDCMDQHLATSKFCPMCRTEVLTPRSSPTR